jgi:glycerol-3-phosphate dehydrogenase
MRTSSDDGAERAHREGLQGGIVYTDAKTDDARLVLRVLQEAQDAWRRGGQLRWRAVAAAFRRSITGDRRAPADAATAALHEVRARGW